MCEDLFDILVVTWHNWLVEPCRLVLEVVGVRASSLCSFGLSSLWRKVVRIGLVAVAPECFQ
jgi:hypothetical protein